MTRDELAQAGRALFGERWQSPLARALGMGDRHMRRLAAGETPVSAGIARDVTRLLGRLRAGQALDEIDKLMAAQDGPPVEIALTQGRDAVGRQATVLVAKALRARGIAVRIVHVPEDDDDPVRRAAKAAANYRSGK